MSVGAGRVAASGSQISPCGGRCRGLQPTGHHPLLFRRLLARGGLTPMTTASTPPATAAVRSALEAGQGILRLAPTWVPRSFLMPGRRIKLHPNDIYAYGAHRGGIDERWFASTTPASNEGRVPDEGLSYVVVNGQKSFTLLDAI